jgi:MFS family permease
MSDRIGRKKMYLIGAVATGLFGFLYFGMVDTAIPSAVFIAIVLSLIPHDMQYGPQAALIAEAFTPRLRYSGSSLGYQLASVIAGGPAPSSPPRCSLPIIRGMRFRSIWLPAQW